MPFQSTPPYGGDTCDQTNETPGSDFNPRPHTGATQRIMAWGSSAEISIHAPIRGRLKRFSFSFMALAFQSTPPYGGDYMILKKDGRCYDFNPRPHTGATNTHDIKSFFDFNFNPRPHTGATVRRDSTIILSHTRLISRKSSSRFLKSHPWVLFLSVCFPFALAEPAGQTEPHPANMQTQNSLLFYHF